MEANQITQRKPNPKQTRNKVDYGGLKRNLFNKKKSVWDERFAGIISRTSQDNHR